MKNIVLIGMPGSGKSAIAKELAEKLSRKYLDSDKLYVEAYGLTPAESIATSGEINFREWEWNLYRRISRDFLERRDNIVLACGGGVVARRDNLDLIKKNSVIVYIKRNLDKLEVVNRPVSMSRSLEELFAERGAKYEDWADIVVENNGELEDAVNAVIKISEME